MDGLDRRKQHHPDYPEFSLLLQHMREGTNEDALYVVKELRRRGWLADGSLTRVFLVNANLSRADLSKGYLVKARLNDADLNRADLSETDLEFAVLIRATLSAANLYGANLRHVNLMNANLDYANLTNARLSNADLTGAKFYKAKMTNATLESARLVGASLTATKLDYADLRGANLSKVDLSNADLTGADLRGADLSGANMSGASLASANLSNAVSNATIFSDIDLSHVTSLDEVTHHGPSAVDFQTLSYVQGRLPLSFLRGVGFSDTYIEFLPSLFNDPIQFYSAFISYSFEDSEFAKRLHEKLQGTGIRCWLAEHDLRPGEIILDRVGEVVRTYDKVILVCSENSLTSWWVEDEIEKTLEMERAFRKNTGKKILKLIPVRIDDYVLDAEKFNTGHAQEVRKRLVADFTEWKNHDEFEAAVNAMIPALRTRQKLDPEPKLGRENE